ncbi:MAG: methylaspartate ammonia-lyase [Pseudomonadota bacterium]
MDILSAHFVPGHSAFYYDDQAAIRAGATHNGFSYDGAPVTPGFKAIRQPGETISVLLELADGQWAAGDCCAVQYSGAGGRYPLFTAEHYLDVLRNDVAAFLEGRDARDFTSNVRALDEVTVDEAPLHTAIRYGVSQALLDAAACAHRCTKTEVICRAYDLALPSEPVALIGQSGDDRYTAVDKMLLRRVDALPHALINNVDTKLGHRGERLLEYVTWLRQRMDEVRALTQAPDTYRPVMHIDVYGTVGVIFDNDPVKVADYLCRLADAAGHYTLYLEGPVDTGGKAPQIACLAEITRRAGDHSDRLRIVADEWCNTREDIVDFVDARCCHMAQIKTPDLGSLHNVVEAVLYCRANDVEAYQGGSCNETDIAARCCTQVALACRPDRLLVKPGMGFDEGMQIVSGEMRRTLTRLNAATGRASSP